MNTPSISKILEQAFARILRPMIRLALSHGVTYPALAEILKFTFVDVAQQDFKISNEAASDSRINLLTSIHRKEIKRLRELSMRDTAEISESVSLGAQLVGLWLSQAPYIDEAGHPKPLPRLASAGGEASFETLVTLANKDIRSRVVLDEWLRLGVASINERDEVTLNTQAFIPSQGFEEKSFYFTHNLHDHAAAASANMRGQQPPWLERSVHYDALSADSIEELNQLAHQAGMEMLQRLNRRAIELEARDAAILQKNRFTCGIYFYSEATSQRDVENT
jgi:hypothetical protein